LPFCTSCGTQTGDNDRFCKNCGNNFGAQSKPIAVGQTISGPADESFDEEAMESHPIDDMSRLSRAGVEKFLVPGERIVYSTPGRIFYGGAKRHVHVTNRRVMFYTKEGVLIKHDRLDEVPVSGIRIVKLVEMGLVRKKVYLELDEMKLLGPRGDLLSLYKSIQSARAAA